MPRKSSSITTIGVIGSGEVPPREVAALLDEFLAGKRVTFELAVTAPLNTTVHHVAQYLIGQDIPFNTITNQASTSDRDVKVVLDEGENDPPLIVKTPGIELVKILEDAPSAELLVLWDDDDLVLQQVCASAQAAGVPVFDLTAGCTDVVFELSDEEDPDEDLEAQDDPHPEDTTETENDRPLSPAVAEAFQAVAEAAALEEEEDQAEAAIDAAIIDAGAPEARGADDVAPYTREELDTFPTTAGPGKDSLKVIAEEDFGLELYPRIRRKTIIGMILEAQGRSAANPPGEPAPVVVEEVVEEADPPVTVITGSEHLSAPLVAPSAEEIAEALAPILQQEMDRAVAGLQGHVDQLTEAVTAFTEKVAGLLSEATALLAESRLAAAQATAPAVVNVVSPNGSGESSTPPATTMAARRRRVAPPQ